MIRRFCDPCGVEIEKSANRDVWNLEIVRSDGVTVQVRADTMISINGVTNAGEICRDCIVRTVSEGTPEVGTR